MIALRGKTEECENHTGTAAKRNVPTVCVCPNSTLYACALMYAHAGVGQLHPACRRATMRHTRGTGKTRAFQQQYKGVLGAPSTRRCGNQLVFYRELAYAVLQAPLNCLNDAASRVDEQPHHTLALRQRCRAHNAQSDRPDLERRARWWFRAPLASPTMCASGPPRRGAGRARIALAPDVIGRW